MSEALLPSLGISGLNVSKAAQLPSLFNRKGSVSMLCVKGLLSVCLVTSSVVSSARFLMKPWDTPLVTPETKSVALLRKLTWVPFPDSDAE